jgi:N-acetylmuramoyl-L-alanine amidase
MSKIAISSGHSTKCQGASDILNEVAEATRVVDRVAEYLRMAHVEVETFHDTVSTSQNENLNRIVDWHNSKTRDLDISVHFNAYQHTSKPMGTEVLYVTQSSLASKVSAAICEEHDLPNRGAKYRSDLFFLNSTEEPAILLEIVFVDSSADASEYRENFDSICMAIAESVSGVEIDDKPVPPEPPEPEEPPELTDQNRVEITGSTTGDVAVIINGTLVRGEKRCLNTIRMNIKMIGDVTVSINGEEFNNKPPVVLEGPLSEEDQDAIKKIANGSAIADYSWRDRGTAPSGYTAGVSLTFANVYRKLLMDHVPSIEMSQARDANNSKDVFNVYKSKYESLGLSNETSGPDTLVNLFALLLGLGMRESSGKHCCGRDMSADNVTSDTCEAGAWQTSYNAHSFSSSFDQLFNEYSEGAEDDDPQGFLDVYEQGVSCSSSDWSCYGSGNGYEHQEMSKRQPAYAAEVAAITLRNRSDHYGPINRQEAELRKEAVDLFKEIVAYFEGKTAPSA